MGNNWIIAFVLCTIIIIIAISTLAKNICVEKWNEFRAHLSANKMGGISFFLHTRSKFFSQRKIIICFIFSVCKKRERKTYNYFGKKVLGSTSVRGVYFCWEKKMEENCSLKKIIFSYSLQITVITTYVPDSTTVQKKIITWMSYSGCLHNSQLFFLNWF